SRSTWAPTLSRSATCGITSTVWARSAPAVRSSWLPLDASGLCHLRGSSRRNDALWVISCFLFEAEDGIRGRNVTGVQTCALPISSNRRGIMKKGRNTTLKERMEVAQYTISNNYNYQEAAEKYQVSYQQVYSWVRKYERDGEQGLEDRRGKTLESKTVLTVDEKLHLRVKELDYIITYLDTVLVLCKKMEEVERDVLK